MEDVVEVENSMDGFIPSLLLHTCEETLGRLCPAAYRARTDLCVGEVVMQDRVLADKELLKEYRPAT